MNYLSFTGIPGKLCDMKVFIPNSAFLGNINSFLSKLDTNEPDRLEITSNPNWIAIHPVILSMIRFAWEIY